MQFKNPYLSVCLFVFFTVGCLGIAFSSDFVCSLGDGQGVNVNDLSRDKVAKTKDKSTINNYVIKANNIDQLFISSNDKDSAVPITSGQASHTELSSMVFIGSMKYSGHWEAIIQAGEGQLYTVGVNTKLLGGRYVVNDINAEGVQLLELKGNAVKNKKIMIKFN